LQNQQCSFAQTTYQFTPWLMWSSKTSRSVVGFEVETLQTS